MRYKCQGKEPPMILTSTLLKISNTKLGHMEVVDFWKMMRKEDKSPLTQRTLESGLAHAGRHPLVVQYAELVLECIEEKISTKLGSKQSLDANIITRLSTLLVPLDSCIKNLLGYVIELDEVKKRHDLCKLKMLSLIIIKNKTLA